MRVLCRVAKLWALPALLLLMSACASGVTRSPEMAAAPPVAFGTDRQVRDVSISLAPEAQQVASTTIRFDQGTLLRLVRQGLEQKKALSAAPNQVLPSVEILVTSIRSRSTFNAVMFGFMAGDDHIKGDVIVRSPDGAELHRFGVSASYAFGGVAGGQVDTRMGWLYEAFAKHVIEELTGQSAKSPTTAGAPTS
jgi:hypothetical protein